MFAHLWGVGGFSLPSSPIRPCPWALRFCLIMFERTSPGVFTSAYSASEAPISHWPSQEPIYWRYLPYIRPICQAYVREYPHKIWPYMVQYLHFRILKIINGWWMQPPSFRKREDVLNYYNLVGGWPTPLKNMTSSVGMMTFPIYIYIYIYGKIKNVPNHEPVIERLYQLVYFEGPIPHTNPEKCIPLY